ncbi:MULTISPECIES: hypothetical protein [unclassified Flavobacterium]|uniref:hypothetical protein n=1 Tax=unclassified Flavobacterium TaxID=196869 RepID=UPI00086F4AAC|nr:MULTISPECIES: hypothetical protein [unclassified Flavobacterium]MBN9285637.1 hypothetical protein [Flavobacterium sp.]ODS91929.1 MAG: hypothetical protein ABS44_00080 [Chryseobacterium sp. SCN 40-13]OJV71007.1 MAG: hypothetical protein BGO42_04125 [Flavobacterium sp. 40-81]
MSNTFGLSGPGNDYRHQIIISYIIYDLMKKFVKVKSYQNYIVLPELSLKPRSSKIPDLTVYKTIKGMPVEAVLLIEICNTNKIKDDTKKLSELMENMLSVKEAFVIDKNSLDITKICRTKTNKPTAPKKDSKIELLKVNLSKTLKILNNSFITSRS